MVISSSEGRILPYGTLDDILSREETPRNCHTKDERNSWFAVDLGLWIFPTAYTARCVHVHAHVYVCTCVYIHIYTCKCIHMYLCVHVYTCTCIRMYLCVHVHARVYVHVCTCTHTCIHTYMYVLVCTCIAYIYVYYRETHLQCKYVHVQYASKKSCQYRLPFDRSVQTAFCQNGTVTSKNGSHRLSVPFTVGRCRSDAREQARALTR